MAGSTGMLVVRGCSDVPCREAHGTGDTCSQRCVDVIFQGKGKRQVSVTQDEQKGVFFSRYLWQGGGSPVVGLSVVHRDKGWVDKIEGGVTAKALLSRVSLSM